MPPWGRGGAGRTGLLSSPACWRVTYRRHCCQPGLQSSLSSPPLALPPSGSYRPEISIFGFVCLNKSEISLEGINTGTVVMMTRQGVEVTWALVWLWWSLHNAGEWRAVRPGGCYGPALPVSCARLLQPRYRLSSTNIVRSNPPTLLVQTEVSRLAR